MEPQIKISEEQILMTFVATCIETVARFLNADYKEVYLRMENAGMIDNFIIPNYGPLHSESREVLAERLVECLKIYDSPTKSPVIQEIIMSNRIGAISVELARRLDIKPSEALKLFYVSETCRNLHDKATGLYLYGDLYIADEFIREMQNRQ